MNTLTRTLFAALALSTAVTSGNAALPDTGMEIVKGRTALVITDPQNDFLSPKGVAWVWSARASRPTTPSRTSRPC